MGVSGYNSSNCSRIFSAFSTNALVLRMLGAFVEAFGVGVLAFGFAAFCALAWVALGFVVLPEEEAFLALVDFEAAWAAAFAFVVFAALVVDVLLFVVFFAVGVVFWVVVFLAELIFLVDGTDSLDGWDGVSELFDFALELAVDLAAFEVLGVSEVVEDLERVILLLGNRKGSVHRVEQVA